MYTVTETVYFCYGHRLLEYRGKCIHPHGHNGKVEIKLAADRLDRLGMVVDFSEIGEAMKGWVDDHLDHRMLLRRDDPLCEVLRKMGEPFFSMEVNPTAEAIARTIYEEALGRGFPVKEVRLWETESSVASYSGETATQR
ncbi:MAG TPA: 6-carboxytetrahydropterin synthase [Candidatus Polarisedimenticolia bacterium]|jgi:6-pyruvoyltetrahydropterin/6-carboxytetrahydropterin synthase